MDGEIGLEDIERLSEGYKLSNQRRKKTERAGENWYYQSDILPLIRRNKIHIRLSL